MKTSTTAKKSVTQRKNLSNSLKLKTNFTLIVVLLLIFTSLTIIVYNSIHSQIEKDTENNMVSHLDDMHTILSDHVRLKQSSVNIALKLAHNIFEDFGDIKVNKQMIEVSGINQVTKEQKNYLIPEWKINNVPMYKSTHIVDFIKSQSVETATIFQKIEDGYLRISTNVLKLDSTRAVGTFIPNSSEVIQTVEQGKTFYGRAFVVNDWYLTAYEPIIIGGVTQGILYVGVKEREYAFLKRIFEEKRYYENGYPFLVDSKGNLIIHPTKEGENYVNASFFKQLINSKDGDYKSEYTWPEGKGGKEKVQFFKYFEPYQAYISTSIYKDDMYADLNRLLALTTILLLISGVLIYFVLSRFLNPIIQQMVVMAHNAEEVASGNLTLSIHSSRKDELGMLANAINRMITKLKEVVSEIVAGAEQLNASGIQFDSTSQDISQGASEQASSIEEVSSTMEEISANIEQNSANATETEKISKQVTKEIQKVNKKAKKAQEFNELIAEKIVAINDIAFQTNILSLNAAIEASKAGEQGRGFNVVAAEVRKLAENSKNMAIEIVKLVNDSVEMTQSASHSLEELVPTIQQTSKLVQNITTAGLELETGVNQVSTALQQINASTVQNAAGSEELASGAKELSSQSTHLMKLISYFKTGDSYVTVQKEVSASDILQSEEPVDLIVDEKPEIIKDMDPQFEKELDSENYEKF